MFLELGICLIHDSIRKLFFFAKMFSGDSELKQAVG